MTWIRTRPTTEDNAGAGLAALAVAAGVGVATFYLVRLFLAREPVALPEARTETPPDREREGARA